MSNSKSLKKKIIIAIVSIASAAILLFGLMFLLEYISNSLAQSREKENSEKADEKKFYPADYTENIFEDEKYMQLDRYIYFSDIDTGYTDTSIDGNYSKYGNIGEFLAEYVNCIINGDVQGYNACFSEEYFKNNAAISGFTMQKLYKIKLTKLDYEVISENGEEYYRYTYSLDYCIYRNNGTFRKDIASDECRTVFLSVTDRFGKYLIDKIVYFGL